MAGRRHVSLAGCRRFWLAVGGSSYQRIWLAGVASGWLSARLTRRRRILLAGGSSGLLPGTRLAGCHGRLVWLSESDYQRKLFELLAIKISTNQHDLHPHLARLMHFSWQFACVSFGSLHNCFGCLIGSLHVCFGCLI
jgi:hypothetical protein